MSKKTKKILFLVGALLLMLAGYKGFSSKNSFYKSAYNDELPTEQTQQDKQEGKAPKSRFMAMAAIKLLAFPNSTTAEKPSVRTTAARQASRAATSGEPLASVNA